MVPPNDVLPPPLDEIGSRLAPFCQRHGIARLESVRRPRTRRIAPGSDIDPLVTFQPDVHLGWDFFELHKEIEDILGCEVDLLTRRSVEQDENAIRRRSILQSTREIYQSRGRASSLGCLTVFGNLFIFRCRPLIVAIGTAGETA